jgi:hypothetical protein
MSNTTVIMETLDRVALAIMWRERTTAVMTMHQMVGGSIGSLK